jgi:hypothetical protein
MQENSKPGSSNQYGRTLLYFCLNETFENKNVIRLFVKKCFKVINEEISLNFPSPIHNT